jgi:NitT/TauT family transport system substrate-binding protein
MAIVLQETLRAVFYAPFYAALALGAYRDEGLEVELVTAPEPAAAARSLAEGRADVAWGGPMRVLHTYATDPACDLVCFCEVATRDPFFLVGRTAKPDFRLADLLGARLASVSEVPTPWLCLQEDMRRAGLDPARLARISNRSMAQNCDALRQGTVDVVQVFEPFVEELIEAGQGHIWSAAADRGPTAYTTLYAPRRLLSTRRQDCERMVRAIYRTLKWVDAADGADLAAAIAGYFPDQPQSRLAKALDRYRRLGIWGHEPDLSRPGFERLRAGLLSGGLIASAAPYERVVDNSLAERVRQQDPPALKGPSGGS